MGFGERLRKWDKSAGVTAGDRRSRPPWCEDTFEDAAIRAEFLKVTLDPGDVVLVFPRKEF